jgi:tRNA(Glu) U13 pseudouridine synthase TruD
MYVHAYQSYVWNAIVSERIKTYGCDAPVVGDLVFDHGAEVADAEVLEVPMDVEIPPADAPIENEIDAQDTVMLDAPAEEPGMYCLALSTQGINMFFRNEA